MAQTCFELFEGETAISILIKSLKYLFELLDIVRTSLHRNGRESSLLQFAALHVLLESIEISLFEMFRPLILLCVLLEPLVVESLLSCKSLLWPSDQLLDEVFRFL